MNAPLELVAAVADDESPLAVWVAGEGAPVGTMSRQRARQLTDATRLLLHEAGGNLAELRAGNAHLALGFAHWHEYVEVEFGDLYVYKLARTRAELVVERQALVASMTLAGFTVREQRDKLGAGVATVHADQRTLGLVPDKPLPVVDAEVVELDPYRGLSPRYEVLARVAAQAERGLTSLELDAELERPLGTATGSLSKLDRAGLVEIGTLDEARRNRRPYRVTELGHARLAELVAARDAAEAVAGRDEATA